MWSAYLRDRTVEIVYHPDEPGGKIWAGEIELHRGAPSVQDHPELQHAFMAIQDPEMHREWIRHRWEWEIPDEYEGFINTGKARRFLMLYASGAEMGWTLVLKLPPDTPSHVWTRICAAFRARPKGEAHETVGYERHDSEAGLALEAAGPEGRSDAVGGL